MSCAILYDQLSSSVTVSCSFAVRSSTLRSKSWFARARSSLALRNARSARFCSSMLTTHPITRASNNFGPYQYPEKLIPLFVTNAIDDLPLPLYGDGKNVRDWLYVDDHCAAIDFLIET